jgi:hypothetical protein
MVAWKDLIDARADAGGTRRPRRSTGTSLGSIRIALCLAELLL